MSETSNKGQIALIVGLLVAAAAVTYYVRGGGSHHSNTRGYFVDEETGEESIGALNESPPLLGKSQKPTVVREFKYSDDGGKTYKVAYYFKFTDETKKKLDAMVAAGKNISDMDVSSSELVRSPEPGAKWVTLGSDQGQAISHIDIPQGKEDLFSIAVP